MKDIFKEGDKKCYHKIITAADLAQFDDGVVHEVYATFAMARDAEWAGRLFVLDMLEQEEEGIGTRIEMRHHSPAFIGDEIVITAIWQGIQDREIITQFEISTNNRIVGEGITGQKIVNTPRLKQRFDELRQSSILR